MNGVLASLLAVFTVFLLIGTFRTISHAGKPRPPYPVGGELAVATVLNFIFLIVLGWTVYVMFNGTN